MSKGKRAAVTVAWLLVGAVAVRLGALVLLGSPPPYGDENAYLIMAQSLAGLGAPFQYLPGYPGGRLDVFLWWAPLQGILLLPTAWAVNGPLTGRVVSAVTSGLVVLPLHAIARREYGERAAAWAGWLYALLPGYVLFGTYLWSENLCVLLALVAVWAAYQGRGVGSGLAWGLTALVRVSSLPWLPVAAVWHWLRSGRSVRSAARWALPCVALVVGYSAWNSRRAGYPLLVADTAGYSLYYGNNPWIDPSDPVSMAVRSLAAREALGEAETHGEFLSLAAARGRQFILAHPGLFLLRGVRKLGWTWGPYTWPVMRIEQGAYPGLLGPARHTVALVVLGGTHLAVLALALVGAGLGWRHDYTRLVVWLAVVTSLGCFALVGLSRYAYPLMVMGLPMAGYAVARVGERQRRRE